MPRGTTKGLIGIVDDSPVYRRGLSLILAESGFDVLVVNEERLEEQVVDVLVIGVARGRESIREARATSTHKNTPIVAIVPPAKDGPLQHAAALSDGAIAAVSRDAPWTAIVCCIEAANDDWSILAVPAAHIRVFGSLVVQATPLSSLRLEYEELSLLHRLFAGATRQAIAKEFNYAPRTVDRRLEGLYQKLGASNRADAMLRALIGGHMNPLDGPTP